MEQSGKDWLVHNFLSRLSDKPLDFGEVLLRHSPLFSGDTLTSLARGESLPEEPKSISLGIFVIDHRYQSFVDELCEQHSYAVQDDAALTKGVRLVRGGVVFEVTKVSIALDIVSGEGEETRLGRAAAAFVRAVYDMARLVSGIQAVHLMDLSVLVCLPLGLCEHRVVEPGGLLPVAGAVCCSGHTPRRFCFYRAAYTMSEDEINEEQVYWAERGHLLAPAPAELWVLARGL